MEKSQSQKILLVVAALVAFPLIAYFDRRTGFEYNFAFFYLLTIVSLTWYGGKAVGYTLIAIGTLIIIGFDYYRQKNQVDYGIVVWDSFWSMMTLILGVILVNGLRTSLEREKQLSRTDPLTGLPNRRSFEERAETSWQLCKRRQKPVTLGYLDLDNFKTVNDTRGHDEGDRVLIATTQVLQNNLRKMDLIARIGGDEFILFLPETSEDLAQSIIERLQQTLQAVAQSNDWPISASIGLITDHKLETPLSSLIHEADGLMYTVKQSGKRAMRIKTV